MTTTLTAPPSAAIPLADGSFADGSQPPVRLTTEDGVALLRLARATVAATATNRLGSMDPTALLEPGHPVAIDTPAAAFVTLHEDGRLRACVGCLSLDQPLWMSVVSAAVGAASRDPRVRPVAEWEVPLLSIDVSVLGPSVPLRDIAAFRPGQHGVIVERGARRGLMLPEVAVDQGWGALEMLQATCGKAGLPTDAWRTPGTVITVFETTRFSEAEAAR